MSTPGTWPTRLMWMVAIWALSVASLGIVAWLLRLFMHWAGLSLPGGA